jgi:CRP/FNR family transcriptional regulator, cyclic AMP receptor protein
LGSREITALIRAVEGFEGDDDIFPVRLSAADWAQLASVMEPIELRPGELLLRRGETGRRAYLVESGQLQVFVTGGAPRSHRIATLRGGTMVGEPALFAPTPRMAHVEAAEPSVVWALAAESLLSLSPSAPALVLEVLRAAGVLMTARRRANLERGIPVT